MNPRTAAVPGERTAAVADRRTRADRARQVADAIRTHIVSGIYAGGVLPREPELVAEFRTTRNTVRHALDLLRVDGLVERCPGVGTVVTADKYSHGLDRLLGLAEVMREHGPISNEVRAASVVVPPRAVASRLELPDGALVIYLERLRRLGGIPLSLDLTYLPTDVGEQLLDEDLANRDVFGLIEHTTGHRLGDADVAIEAVNADPHSAAVLDTPRDAALLLVERLTRLDDGRPVDLEFIRFRADRITMRAQVTRS